MDKNNTINTPSIFIISSGRTATNFFSFLLSDIIPNSDSFHEPDAFTSPIGHKLVQIHKNFGLFKTIINKFKNHGNLRKLSIARENNIYDDKYIIESIYNLRKSFIEHLTGSVYVESNLQLNGLIDLLPHIFTNSKIIYIVRDGRDWITSFINHSGGKYSNRDLMYKLGLGRLSAQDIEDDPWHHEWKHFNQFQKLCWLWQKENQFAIKSVEQCNNAQWWRYEDFFHSHYKLSNFTELIEFATNFPDGTRVSHFPFENLIDNRIHASKPDRFPKWPEWDNESAFQFHQICGDLMSKLGYGEESEWLEKINYSS